MRKRIIAAALAAAMLLTMPLYAMAAGKPDEIASPAQLEETNEDGTVRIKESHSYLEKRYEYGKTIYYVYYAVLVENTYPDYAVDFVSLKASVFGSDGSVLKTDEETLDWIAERDSYWYAGYVSLDSEGITPTRMEYTISANERNFHKASASNQAIRAGELAVTNVSKRGSGYDLRYTGQVTNNSQFTSNWIKVIVIYKMKDTEGNEVPVGGDCTYITDALPSGQTTTFELYPLSGFTGYSSYEIIALQD